MTLKNNRAPLLSNIKLYASFRHHMWIQTGVTVRKRLRWVVTSVTLTFDLWPWPFAWTLRRSLVITPENFMMIRWWEHSQKGVTDRRTDGQTDRQTENTICRAAWSQLKITQVIFWLALNGKDINLGIPLDKRPQLESGTSPSPITCWLASRAFRQEPARWQGTSSAGGLRRVQGTAALLHYDRY